MIELKKVARRGVARPPAGGYESNLKLNLG
jgi:hypothetical protein